MLRTHSYLYQLTCFPKEKAVSIQILVSNALHCFTLKLKVIIRVSFVETFTITTFVLARTFSKKVVLQLHFYLIIVLIVLSGFNIEKPLWHSNFLTHQHSSTPFLPLHYRYISTTETHFFFGMTYHLASQQAPL